MAILENALSTHIFIYISKTIALRRLILGSRSIFWAMTFHISHVTHMSDPQFFSKWLILGKILLKMVSIILGG